eukprot:Lithocolla_globosa_v1_NODE_5683_length_1201_cov_757.212914.p1 type:complete len:154 gc:universal NODE_5683_length_1201_cov_757.212914:1077-616(-)
MSMICCPSSASARGKFFFFLDKQSFDGIADCLDLGLQLRTVIGGDGAGNDRPGDTAGATKGLLGRHKHVRNVLILAQQRQVEKDLQWFCISSHHNKLTNSSVQGFGSFICSLLQLFVVRSLLNDVDDLLSKFSICERKGFGVQFCHCLLHHHQ